MLSLIETRILGCLLEKERTTPDLYPLSLNALVNACNQKSNRHPVLALDDDDATAAIESLRLQGLALLVTQADARVPKFRHSLEKHHPLSDSETAILTELLLRGPQTPGELRQRCARLSPFPDLASLRATLDPMTQGESPLVVELPRQPGKKDARFAHTLSGPPEESQDATPSADDAPLQVAVTTQLPAADAARIDALESETAQLKDELSELKEAFVQFRSQFE